MQLKKYRLRKSSNCVEMQKQFRLYILSRISPRGAVKWAALSSTEFVDYHRV